MPYENCWGINAYYGASLAQSEKYEEKLAVQVWQDALSKVIPDAKKQVEQAKDKWNSRVRELLRGETGLKFLRNEFAENKPQDAENKNEQKNHIPADESLKKAPIKIVDGFPPPLSHYFEDITDDPEILLRRQDFAQARTTLEFAKNNFERLLRYTGKNDNTVNPQTLQYVSEFFNGLIIEADQYKLMDRILYIDEDCLGAYFFRRPEIHIYWLPIAILAQSSPIADIESLTFIVLAHELAHAYTHQGKDIDGTDWYTEHFAYCDKGIVEGIAQYYTWQLCKRMKFHSSRFESSFNWMLEKQSETYTRFRKWVGSDNSANKKSQYGEVMRAAMLQMRRNQVDSLNNFESEIHKSRERLDTKR
jgi:hypothetical protein